MNADHGKSLPDISEKDGGTYADASKERLDFADESLERDARKLQHNRREGIRKWVHRVAVFLIILAGVILSLMLFTWAWHVMAPWPYLSEDKYEELKNMLFSAAIAAFVSDYAKKML
ncbi:MAG: hypothetical protein OXI60_00860 [Acidiferrobacterales bacterium]|nr:hypothetical protein [Acidiferrobacterales bacterium]